MFSGENWTGEKTNLSNMFKMGSLWLPNPTTKSANQTIATFVNSGRNTEGQVIGQKIGRDQSKIELEWNYLTAYQWSTLLQFWDRNFFFTMEYFDMRDNLRRTREFYVGDRSATPFNINTNGNVLAWVDCKANIIETGR